MPNLLVGVSSVDHSGARQVVAAAGSHGQPMAAHQRSRDQLDDLKVLLQVLDDALSGRTRGKKGCDVLLFSISDTSTGALFSPCPAFDRSA